MNSVGDNCTVGTIYLNNVQQLTSYLGTSTNFIDQYTMPYVSGTYRYVGYINKLVANAGNNQVFNFTITGLPSLISFNALLQYVSGDGEIYTKHQANWSIVNGTLTVPIVVDANTGNNTFLFKIVFDLYQEKV